MEANKFILIIIISLGVLIALSASLPVTAVTVKKLGTVKVDSQSTILVDNDNAPKFVKSPKTYGQSKRFAKTKGFEIKKNKIKTKEGKKYAYITKYFLPTFWKKINGQGKTNEYWYNCQSITIHGKYMYVLSSSGYNLNKGFIIRYNMKLLDKYNADNGKGLASLRKLGAKLRDKKPLTKQEKRLKKAIKIGPIFKVGHGQSLTLNPKTKSLWMWQDANHNSSILKLMQISKVSLKPLKAYKFSISYNGRKLHQFFNLAFDKNGNFYMNRNIKLSSSKFPSLMIFTGKITKNMTNIQIKLLTIIKNSPGTYSQSIAINPINNRLYLVSDGVFYSIPINKLINGTLTKNDFHYSVFSTTREFEGITFDNYGKSYLLILRGTEVLKSNRI
ncbi:hypothetical protein MBCUT_04560 [Methanobrevibacter cuticularis]|uniref:Uncharacterized protein n=1 Tax=Methanobrevibacter cuticularis TaxID=47311 RepID=A0A166EQP2_9EURY|nr:hypothetical protein [Methanobrevibacter cuticularis]KZX16905.1 hypothetical protein MBCUT_04560 [Methanobrevibacter cuticularis]